MAGFALVALIAAIALLVLIPTRRLFVAGWPPRVLTAYFVTLTALGVFIAEFPGPARFLVPILVVAYIAPFVTARAGIARLVGGTGVRTIPRPLIGEPPSSGKTDAEIGHDANVGGDDEPDERA